MSVTVKDLFAGAGGSSTGMSQVPGVEVKIAANHWKLACDVHNANHPDTDHAVADLHQENPRYFPTTDILWASPECTKWSQANGSKLPSIDEGLFEDPLSSEAAVRSRMLMFDVLKFIEFHRYRRVIIENVVDIAMLAKYRTAWLLWQRDLRNLGYTFRVVSLNSMHAQFGGLPAPQSRDRLYIVAWPVGDRAPDIDKVLRPKAWCPKCEVVGESQQAFKPGRKVGRYRAQYVYVHSCGTIVEPAWLPAAAAIDWTIPGQRIGDRETPLSPKTMARIEAGLRKFGRPMTFEAAGNTFVRTDEHGVPRYVRGWPVDEPTATFTTSETRALVVPLEGREGINAHPVTDPLRTQTARHQDALLVPYYTTRAEPHPVTDPMGTLTTVDRFGLLVPAGGTWHDDAYLASDPLRTMTTRESHGLAFIAELRGMNASHNKALHPISDPLATFTAGGNHHMLVRQNGEADTGWQCSRDTDPMYTLTTKGHQSVVSIVAAVEDATFRMLEPHEVAAGMAFPGDYDWKVRNDKGNLPSRRDLVKLAGNAVTPPSARDLMHPVVESLDAA